MLGDEDDVFDSVTWESPADRAYDSGPSAPSGPGFRQSTSEDDPNHGPNDPKWEGYLVTVVKDPVKELAETKDAYVSYLVTAKVRRIRSYYNAVHLSFLLPMARQTCLYSRHPILHHGGGSRILSFYENTSPRTSRHALCHRYRTSTGWVSRRVRPQRRGGFDKAI